MRCQIIILDGLENQKKMQLTNDQISAVSLWMKEHGIDEHLIGVFEKEWMKGIVYTDAPLDAFLGNKEKFRADEELISNTRPISTLESIDTPELRTKWFFRK